VHPQRVHFYFASSYFALHLPKLFIFNKTLSEKNHTIEIQTACALCYIKYNMVMFCLSVANINIAHLIIAISNLKVAVNPIPGRSAKALCSRCFRSFQITNSYNQL